MRLTGNTSIRKYVPRDYPMIVEWARIRGIQPPKQASLSTQGYIADERVAGWLYMTDSNIAIIECIISNPHTVPSLRRFSLRKLLGFLIDKANALGYTNIIGITKHPAMKSLANDLGFVTDEEFRIYALREKE